MSAVSSSSGSSQAGSGSGSAPPADFGANEWLVEELYQRYLADPGSVDRAWWSFFADYQPSLPNGTGPQPVLPRHAPQAATQAPAPAAPAAPAPAAEPAQPPAAPSASPAAAPA